MSEPKYTAFGIPMQRRSARRRLVAIVYATLAAICAMSLIFAQKEPLLYYWTRDDGGRDLYLRRPGPIWTDQAVPEQAAPSGSADGADGSAGAQPISAGTPEESSWKNDERELSRRDLAHCRAYTPLSFIMLAILLLATMGLRSALGLGHSQWLTATTALHLIYAAALVGSVLVVTLPAAIILWTESDIEMQ